MSAESFALISVDDKRGLPSLARELAERHRIVSFGTTGEIIKTVAEVISVPEFLGDPELAAYIATLTDEVERRNICAVPLGQRMRQPRAVLADQGREAIDMVYITLKPPKILFDEEGNYAGIDFDTGGAFMIAAAIQGGRHVFTGVQQLSDYQDIRKWPEGDPSGPLVLGKEAANYLELYAGHVRELGEMTVRSAADNPRPPLTLNEPVQAGVIQETYY